MSLIFCLHLMFHINSYVPRKPSIAHKELNLFSFTSFYTTTTPQIHFKRDRKKSILKWLANQQGNDDVKFPWNTMRPKRNAKMRDWGSTNFPPSSELMYLGKLKRTFFIWRRTLIVFYGFVFAHVEYGGSVL